MIMIRPIHNDECDKVSELLAIAGWKIATFGFIYPSAGSTTLVLIVRTGEIAGTLTIHDYNRICNVIVRPEYRGLGYGCLLMEAARGYIVGTPYLYVKFFNWKAVRLYLREGYKIIGQRKKSFKMERSEA